MVYNCRTMKNRRRSEVGKKASNRRLKKNWTKGQDFRSYGKGLAAKVKYIGSPYHKSNPGDFGLTPPTAPRQDATLCDEAGVSSKREAIRLLRKGASYGLVDEHEVNGFPRRIWSVRKDGVVFEARLSNEEKGQYHGYPLLKSDSFSARFRSDVIDAYEERSS